MKDIQVHKNIFIVILAMIVLASALQMNLLGKGLLARFIFSSEGNVYKSINKINSKAIAAQKQQEAFKPERIVIDQVKIDLPVVSVPLKNGTWQVNPGVANFAEGTSLVSKNGGNVGIFAHDRIDGFNKIKSLKSGKNFDIILYGNNYRATYQIQSASVIAPTAIDVFYPTKESMLTLITCDGILSEKRYMVRGKLIKIEKIKN